MYIIYIILVFYIILGFRSRGQVSFGSCPIRNRGRYIHEIVFTDESNTSVDQVGEVNGG